MRNISINFMRRLDDADKAINFQNTLELVRFKSAQYILYEL